jgi:hypothetical protein
MFGALNLVLVVIIVIVIIVHIATTQTRLSSLENKLSSRNFLDMAEFNKLDKEFKRNYQKYVVNGVMPHYMDAANNIIKDNKINKIVRDNKDEIAATIDSLPYIIRSNNSQTKNKSSIKSTSTTSASKAEPTTSTKVKEAFKSYSLW